MAAKLPIIYVDAFLFEVILTGIGLFVAPLMVVGAMAGALTLADRLFH
jgi:hypothetical protein